MSEGAGEQVVSFSTDVHTSQWGILNRLLHAIDLGLVNVGWAIDEDTLLKVTTGGVQPLPAGDNAPVPYSSRADVRRVDLQAEGGR